MSIIINNPTTTTMTNTDSGIRDNYFKNSAFSVIQGTASGTVPNSLALPTASLGYPGESEWCIAASGGTPTYAFSTTNQTLSLGGAASTTAIYVLQRIESRDANRLASKQVTLSVELSNSLLTSVIWELFRPTTTADTHGTIASPTTTVVASGTWTVSSTLTKYTATVTLPAEVSNGLEVRFRVGAQTSGTWVIARPKLEEGSSSTAFVSADYSIELAKCQRYFEVLLSENGVVNINSLYTIFNGNGFYFTPWYFKAEKARIPVISGQSSSFLNSVAILAGRSNVIFSVGGYAESITSITASSHIP